MKQGIPTMPAKLVAECIGTFILSFTVVNNIQAGSNLAALSIASSLMIGVYCTGSVSGGHLNPAVTLGLFLAGKLGGPGGAIPVVEALLYFVSQLVGATLANLAASFIWTTSLGGEGDAGMMRHVHGSLGSDSFPAWRVFEGEVIYTLMLVFVVLNVATCNDMPGGNSYFGLAIGFVIAAAASAEGNVSGTCLNPAVTFAILINNFSKNISQIPVYWGARRARRTVPRPSRRSSSPRPRWNRRRSRRAARRARKTRRRRRKSTEIRVKHPEARRQGTRRKGRRARRRRARRKRSQRKRRRTRTRMPRTVGRRPQMRSKTVDLRQACCRRSL
eukprot:gb/GFBE01030921.1/.p1 GENE.gb/GFBE01030921.1/~~gb/GFBE01030921.1/.p1  ORF type:complete len:331 (+),score=53.18 gb/GFBE01030921.1/:1-993(+)